MHRTVLGTVPDLLRWTVEVVLATLRFPSGTFV
ncbi:hypothetical protein RHDE110596_07650 [Prescottella defluvii]